MRKLVIVFLLALLITSISATTIESEKVVVDLADSRISVSVDVAELTSSRFTYVTNYQISELEAYSKPSGIKCRVQRLQIGSEISCDPPSRNNFSVTMEFVSQDLVSTQGQVKIFRFSQSFNRPTKNYELKVLLPRGAGILSEGNVSDPVVFPSGAEISSDGRRIFTRWNFTPRLGESQNFHVYYQTYSDQNQIYGMIIAGVISILIAATVLYLGYRYWFREDLEENMTDLSEDESRIMDIIIENEGEILQKDLVDQMDYSKAKVSGVVSELVEKELLVKEKEGRSNKLRIPKNFNY